MGVVMDAFPDPRPPAAPHPVQAALSAAVAKLSGLRPVRIVGEPDLNDAHNLIDDLEAVSSIVDPIVAAIGDYAESNFGKLDTSLFKDQLRGALDGNATFEIESAARRLIANRAAAQAEYRREMRRVDT
jgi:hypothetical protein